MMYQKVSLGSFITKGTLVITDPCYTNESLWLKAKVSGTVWKTAAVIVNSREWGIRVTDLLAWDGQMEEPTSFGRHLGNIGVDSGQAGIFDSSLKIGAGHHDEDGSFYGTCCNITLNQASQSGTVLGHGVVSSSGFGDGVYPVYTRIKKGLVTAIRVCCIWDVLDVINTSLDQLPLLIGKYEDGIATEVLDERIRRKK